MNLKPNIILILVDDMGYGDFGVFNHGLTQTPNLDRLVSEGICLTQHYSASPVCAPARAGLLTGRYPHRTGVIDTLEVRGLDRLNLREVTLASIMKSAGYTTGLIGKWHLGALDPRYHPNMRGFDEFVGFSGGWQDYYNWRLDYNGSFQKSDGRYITDVFSDEAIRFIQRHNKEPFFLHLAYSAPHFPYQAPEEEIKPFRETGKFTESVSILYGMLLSMDRGLERLLAEVKRQGIEDNTIIIFTSDNGPEFGGEGEMCTTRFNCGFNGSKYFVYEGGIRVPLVIRWPDGLEGGRHFHEMVHFVDWLPTLMTAARIDTQTPLPIDGQNILPVLRGESDKLDTRRFWQWNRYTPIPNCNAAVRDGDWKLVRPAIDIAMIVSPEDLALDHDLKYYPEKYDGILHPLDLQREVPPPPPPQLFNIAQDPAEENDLSEVETARSEKMLTELETWFEEVETERKRMLNTLTNQF